MDNIILPHPTKSHTHLSSVSLTDIQVDHVAEKVFILVADHDRNLRVVHNLLEIKEPFMPHAGPRRARSISPTLGWKNNMGTGIFKDAGHFCLPSHY